MKAIVATRYGSPNILEVRDVAKPTPQTNEILVKIHATTVTAGDARSRSFKGSPNAGTNKTEEGHSRHRAGGRSGSGRECDPVSAYVITRLSTYAELTSVPETTAIAQKPSPLTYEEAAAIPFGAITALYFLKKASIGSGQTVRFG